MNSVSSALTPENLKIISDNIYSANQLKELYQLCGRFDINQKINF